jgi:NADPH2:quinone reductase
MGAWQVVRHGDPSSALERRDVPVPTPGEGELLVSVSACALNFPDVLLAAGQYQVRREAQDEVGALVASRQVRPLVSERVGLDDVPEALTRLAAGRTTGRVVVFRG